MADTTGPCVRALSGSLAGILYPDGYTAPTYHPPYCDNWGDFRTMRPPLHVVQPDGTSPRYKTELHECLPWLAIEAIGQMMADMLASGRHGRDDWRLLSKWQHVDHARAHIEHYTNLDESEDHLLHAACRLLMAVEQRMTHDLPGFQVETSHVRTDLRVFDDDGDAVTR